MKVVKSAWIVLGGGLMGMGEFLRGCVVQVTMLGARTFEVRHLIGF